MPTGARIEATADQLEAIAFNADGLVPVITQDVTSKDILMMAWMNAESLRMTFDEGRMVYWSRSRRELWRKGDTRKCASRLSHGLVAILNSPDATLANIAMHASCPRGSRPDGVLDLGAGAL